MILEGHNYQMSAQQLPSLNSEQQQEPHLTHPNEDHRQSGRNDQAVNNQSNRPNQIPQHNVLQNREPVIKIDEEKIMAKRGSIFASRKENQAQTNIFANSKSVNLFNSHQEKGVNIFQHSSKSNPLLPNDPQDDLVSHSSVSQEPNPNEQDLKEPSQKEMKYDYKSETHCIDNFKLGKFKKGSESARQNLTLTLQDHRGQMLLVFRNQMTHILVHSAYMVPRRPIKTFMNRDENLAVQTVVMTTTDGNVIYAKESIKMQFYSKEEAQRFRENIDKFWENAKENSMKIQQREEKQKAVQVEIEGRKEQIQKDHFQEEQKVNQNLGNISDEVTEKCEDISIPMKSPQKDISSNDSIEKTQEKNC